MSVAEFTAALPRRRPRRLEPYHVVAIKALLYAGAAALYLYPLSSLAGIAAAVSMAVVGLLAADAAQRRRLRIPVALICCPLALLGAMLLGEWLLDWRLLPATFGVGGSFVAADVVTFGLGALGLVFLLRLLAHRVRALALLEVLFVVGSVAVMLADHRNRMINRPRFLSDWAWSLGIDPTTVLMVVGAGAALAAVLLFLREQPLLKLVTTLLLLLLLGLLYYTLADKRIDAPSSADALGLTGKKRRGGANSDNPFKNNYDPPPPQPVAIAILRDDYAAWDQGVVYFRQRVLSKYNGVHLTAASAGDRDVITQLPPRGSVEAEATQVSAHHQRVPTTMYLLVDHPQPPALTHARRLRVVDNPNPRQFVAAYEVESLVLGVPARRLLGRSSVPALWSPEKRRRYLELPDDPRYRTLSDIIVRGLDPRFADDDLARALAIKRYLEKEGFYTRKSKHASAKDPAASFLFGDMRGYCVHFAHAAVYLFRSQGVAARVALGYAVQTQKRSGGSSLLIMADRAHAWPEVFLDGIGWVTFDIYPERSDAPPPVVVDYDLEKLLGELARKDPTAGVSPEGRPLVVPWGAIGAAAGAVLLVLLALAYLIKLGRSVAPRLADGAYCRLTYLATLDRLSDVGRHRRRGETRERHAARVAQLAPHLAALTTAHLGRALGSARPVDRARFGELAAAVRADLRHNVHPLRRLLGALNPLSWLWTR